MPAAIALADRLDGDAILAMRRALLGTTEPEWAGKWRTAQNWIGGSDWSPHGPMFVPPHPDRVPAAINDLERFLARDDLQVLVQAAVAHAQFETIHPFPTALRASWDDAISARRGASAWRLADMLLNQPIVDSLLVQRELTVTAPAALRAIEQLVDAGVLTKISGRQRYRRYSAAQVLEAVDAFAVRAGR